MICHTVFAIISENEIKNVIVGEFYDCNEIARIDYGNNAFAVEVTQYPVQSGDIYDNGNFYRKNIETNELELIIPIPTMEQQYNILVGKYNELTELIITNELAMVDIMKGGI